MRIISAVRSPFLARAFSAAEGTAVKAKKPAVPKTAPKVEPAVAKEVKKTAKPVIGVIGLGKMGTGVAANLAKANHKVTLGQI